MQGRLDGLSRIHKLAHAKSFIFVTCCMQSILPLPADEKKGNTHKHTPFSFPAGKTIQFASSEAFWLHTVGLYFRE